MVPPAGPSHGIPGTTRRKDDPSSVPIPTDPAGSHTGADSSIPVVTVEDEIPKDPPTDPRATKGQQEDTVAPDGPQGSASTGLYEEPAELNDPQLAEVARRMWNNLNRRCDVTVETHHKRVCFIAVAKTF
eukprot:903056-Amphidinium_carterae.1